MPKLIALLAFVLVSLSIVYPVLAAPPPRLYPVEVITLPAMPALTAVQVLAVLDSTSTEPFVLCPQGCKILFRSSHKPPLSTRDQDFL